METTASIRKHPLHPILVGFPIGLWVFSLVCDLVAYFGGGSQWSEVALYTLGGGIITALVAAIPGIIDLTSIREPSLRRIGIIHMIVNLVVVGLYAVNFALRRGSAAEGRLPVVLSIIGVILLLVSGWLGGELVHVHGVGVAEEGLRGGGAKNI